MNRALVLEAIANHPPLSRADLAKMLHLTKATVSTIVQELLDRQLVIELGSAEKTSMGRKPILLTFNNRCGSIIAVDLGVKKITILTGDLKGKSCTVKEYPIDPSLSLEEYLISLLHKTKSDLPKTPCGLVGISIGIYGVVCDDLVLFTPYYDLKHSNLKNYLEEEFQVPVIVENEANLSVIGEAACAEHFKNMIFLNIHEGVGMGILIDGELYTGQNGYAGEFGHTILFPDGRPCPCGNHGCLEQYISEAAVLNDFAAAEGLENVSVERFIQYYQEGNPNARKVMQDFTHYIGISLNTVLHTFNPDVIVINSSFTNYIPGLIDEITSGIQNRLRWYLHKNSLLFQLLFQQTGNRKVDVLFFDTVCPDFAGIVAAVAAVQHHYFCGCLLCCHQPCALAGQNIRRRKQNHRHQPFQFFPFFQMKSPLLQISFLGHFMQQRGRLQLLLLPVTLPHLLHHARDSGFHPLLRRCHHRDNPAHFRD